VELRDCGRVSFIWGKFWNVCWGYWHWTLCVVISPGEGWGLRRSCCPHPASVYVGFNVGPEGCPR
jgi:hypothetical protein